MKRIAFALIATAVVAGCDLFRHVEPHTEPCKKVIIGFIIWPNGTVDTLRDYEKTFYCKIPSDSK